MSIKVYNTATRQKEEFVPQNPPTVTMYNCGPTVYDFFHIGNARNFVSADIVRRYLKFRGFNVRFVQNLTDIDDKIINRAREKNVAWNELAEQFTGEYFKAAGLLGIEKADEHPKATDHIPHMQKLILKLIERGLAYAKGGDVYFRVREFKSYGALSGKNVDDLLEGARVDVGEEKEDPLDFALWKSAKPGEPTWDSPWGPGRPGWHIECSAMATCHLGETIDIHSGATDLIFPHHENERAQSMGASGKPFVKYWLHNGFLTINKEKMSKSLGNFFTINEVLEKFPPDAVRFYLMSAHYRHPLDYSNVGLTEAQSAVGRIREAVTTADKIAKMPGEVDKSAAQPYHEAFVEAMDDDFNTPKAMGVIFDAVSELNEKRQQLTRQEAAPLAAHIRGLTTVIHELLDVLGLDKMIFAAEEQGAHAHLNEQLIQLLIDTRTLAKKNKQFQMADHIRDELANLGIRLQDHPSGTIWLK